MNVLILTNMAPFVWGGAEALTENLVKNLVRAGHDAEAVRIPFSWEPYDRLVDEMLICRALEIRNVDRVIAMKFPAYLVPFERKVIWLVHQYRQAYDLADSGMSNIPDTPHGRSVRQAIRNSDRQAFEDAAAIFSVSEQTRHRLRRYNGFDSEVLIAPLNDAERFTGGPDGGYVAALGRVNAGKRQTLLLEALALMKPGIPVLIAGPPDTDADADRLRHLVEAHGLGDRVRLELGLLSRDRIADIVNNARAIACFPYDEDSMSYVAMEAAEAAKPVLTLSDSGGVRQLVEHDVTGYVSDPAPEAIADMLAKVMAQPAVAADLGAAARSRWRGLDISWPRTVSTLMG